MKITILSACLLAAAVSLPAFAQSGGAEIKLQPAVPASEPGLPAPLPVDLPTPEDLAAQKVQQERAAAAAAEAARVKAEPAAVDPALANAPKVPASQEGSQPVTAGDAPVTAPGDANFEVGQPVPVFATMEAAAEAGVDPYKTKSTEVPSLQGASHDKVDWLKLDTYLDWLAAQETNGLIVLGAALFAVISGLAIGLRRVFSR